MQFRVLTVDLRQQVAKVGTGLRKGNLSMRLNNMEATRADGIMPTVPPVEVFEDQGDLILENAMIAVVEVGVDCRKAGVVAAENSINLRAP